jgi:biotin transport system substrate-specific component
VEGHSGALSWAREDIVKSRTLRQVIVAVPIPGTPVPFTFQVVCVILAGVVLGPKLGAASQMAYLAAGALGAPIFAMGGGVGYLLGPTGGYLLAFPLAAYAAGAIAGRSRGLLRLIAGLAAGVAVVQAGGAAWLTVTTGSLERALIVGVVPFLALGVVKIALAALISARIRPRALELF